MNVDWELVLFVLLRLREDVIKVKDEVTDGTEKINVPMRSVVEGDEGLYLSNTFGHWF